MYKTKCCHFRDRAMSGSKNRPGRNHFNQEWLEKTDDNGDKVGSYISKIGEFSVKCEWCKTSISIGNLGFTAIKRHAERKGHKNIADCRMNRSRNQLIFSNEVENESEHVDDPDPDVTSVTDDRPPAQLSQVKSNQGLMKYFTTTSTPTTQNTIENTNNNNNSTFTSHVDKVAKAEILMILQAVYKNYSNASLNSLQEIIKLCFPDSRIAQSTTFGSQKAAYVVNEALAPHFLKEVIEDINKADVYVLGLDTATTKHLGLSKGMDIKIRYYSEKYKKIVDVYVSSVNLGHETGEIMKSHVIDQMKTLGLDFKKLFVLSRDNPNVMKTFSRLLIEALTKEGNNRVLEAPCSLHPTHTSLKEGMKKLDLNVDIFLVNIHGWFKLSTARREDLDSLRVELDAEGVNEFFMRHVSTRWLTVEEVITRILKHWEVLCEYFCVYLPKSKEPSHVEAVKNNRRYPDIVKVLNAPKREANLVRLKFVVYLCGKTRLYLKTLQAETPMSYRIHTDACILIANMMTSFVKPQFVPKNCLESEFKAVDLNNRECLLSRKSCDFGPNISVSLRKCTPEIQLILRGEFREAMIAMTKYLIRTLPLKDQFLKDLSFTNPTNINKNEFVAAMLRLGKYTKRFSELELQNLDNQLKMISITSDLPTFDDKTDSFENFWMKVIDKIEKNIGTELNEVSRLIKIVATYPNSQAFLERGFNDTKRISETRKMLSEISMSSIKIILDVVRSVGGPQNIVITPELIGSHQSARQSYRRRLEREKLEKEKESRKLALQKLEERRKRKFDEEKKSWETKVSDIQNEIKVLKTSLEIQEDRHMDALDKVESIKEKHLKESFIKVAKQSTASMKELRISLDAKQEALSKIMSKKPKRS